MLDLSIVIVSYNVREYLQACLSSIYRWPPDRPFELIVVDNVSSDGSADAVRASFPQVRLFESSENAGFAHGNNRGTQESAGRCVLFLNPDTEVREGTLTGLVQFADTHPEAAAYTCRLVNPDGGLQMSCFRFPNLKMAFFGFFPLVPMDSLANGRYPSETFDREFQPEHVLGACLMIRRDALNALGGWDGRYFMYFEETDLCYRLRRSGQTVLYTPACTVVHHGGRSTAAVHEKMSVAFYCSQSYFYRRHYGLVAYTALKAIVALGLCFWTARSLKNFIQGRIDGALLRTRLSGYLGILQA